MRTGGYLGIEYKFYDVKLTGKALDTNTTGEDGELDPATTIDCLNAVTQGDGESQRDGRNLVMKSLLLKGVVNIPAQATQSTLDVAPTIFMAVVLDTQTNGAQLDSELVYKNPSADTRCSASVVRNLQYAKRFKILAKKIIQVPTPTTGNDAAGTFSISGMDIPFEFYIRLPDIKVNYSGTTEAVANIVDNSLHLVGWTSSVTLAPTVSYNSRLRFVG